MAFAIILQVNTSEPNRVTKSIKNIITVQGVLKENTSIIDPIIKIQCDLAAVTSCNYLSIPSFRRSYFINDIRSIQRSIVEFSCHVDVLSSFANEIKSNSAIVKRQENRWNLYLNDGIFKVYQNPSVLTKSFSSGFNTQEFVLAIAGS